MHKVEGKQHTGKSRQAGAAGQLPGEQIHHRDHGNAKQGTNDTPAEGIHAKEGDTCGNEDLPQGRVGVLVGSQALQELIGSAAMVDFIKIHAVAEAAPVRVQMGFIQEGRWYICIHWQKNIAVLIQECEFQQGSLVVLQGHAQVVYPGGEGDVLPGEHIFQGDLSQVGPFLFQLSLAFQGESPVVPGGNVIGQGGRREFLFWKVELQYLALATGEGCSGSLSVSQVCQRKATVDQGDGQHPGKVPPGEWHPAMGRTGGPWTRGQGRRCLGETVPGGADRSGSRPGCLGPWKDFPGSQGGERGMLAVTPCRADIQHPGKPVQPYQASHSAGRYQEYQGTHGYRAGRIIEIQDIRSVVKVQQGQDAITGKKLFCRLVEEGQQQ